MTVVVDEQIFTYQRVGGASRMFVHLLDEMSTRPEVPLDRYWRWGLNDEAARRGWCRPPAIGALQRPRVAQALNLPARRRAVRRAEVWHWNMYSPRFLETPGRGTSTVVTLYDMIPELLPELFPSGNPHLAKRDYMRRADLILSLSQSAADDMARLYPEVDTCKVRIVPLAVSEVFNPDQVASARLPAEFVLFVGNRGGYKDFDVLCRAMAAIETPLVCVGGGDWTAEERLLQEELKIAGRVHQVKAPTDSELAAIYARASVFVFASRYEGFGLPTLEAMACGCPALLARTSSHLEVGGDVAAYFEPEDHESLATELSALLSDASSRRVMRDAGIAHARTFTWRRVTDQTLAAYHELGAS